MRCERKKREKKIDVLQQYDVIICQTSKNPTYVISNNVDAFLPFLFYSRVYLPRFFSSSSSSIYICARVCSVTYSTVLKSEKAKREREREREKKSYSSVSDGGNTEVSIITSSSLLFFLHTNNRVEIIFLYVQRFFFFLFLLSFSLICFPKMILSESLWSYL